MGKSERPAAFQIPTFVITTRFLTLCHRIRAAKMAALLEGRRHTGQMSIFTNYVTIKESVLRCRLTMPPATLGHNEHYVVVVVCVCKGWQQMESNFAGPNELFLAKLLY